MDEVVVVLETDKVRHCLSCLLLEPCLSQLSLVLVQPAVFPEFYFSDMSNVVGGTLVPSGYWLQF